VIGVGAEVVVPVEVVVGVVDVEVVGACAPAGAAADAPEPRLLTVDPDAATRVGPS
jgi:hypothetical protein